MFKLLIPTLLCASLATPALAEASADTWSFSRDGQEYVTTVKTEGDVQIISGKERGNGTRFVLRVADGRVAGFYGPARVDFPVKKAIGADARVTVTASR